MTDVRSEVRMRAVAQLLAIVLLGAACSGGSPNRPDAAAPDITTSTSSACKVINNRPCDLTTVDHPGGLPVVSLETDASILEATVVHIGSHPGLAFGPGTPLPGTSLLVGEAILDPSPKEQVSGGVGVAVLDPSDGTLTFLHRFSSDEWGAGRADSDGTWIVWAEDDTAALTETDWVLWAYNWTTKALHVVARHPTALDGTSPSTPFLEPSVSHGVIAWAATTPDGRLHAYTATANGGTPTVVLDDAQHPKVSWPLVAAVQATDLGKPTVTTHVEITDLVTSTSRDVPGTEGATDVALNDHELVWISGSHPADVFRSDLNGDGRQLLYSGTPQFPSAADGAVAWDAYDQGPMIAVDGRADIVLLHRQISEDVWAKADRVLWEERASTPSETLFRIGKLH